MSLVKAAAHADLEKAAELLEKIRSEKPDLWPNGLHLKQFEPGDLYLIRKQAGEDPVGFVGWQERSMGHKRVGLYSIGVLPEHRHQGVAKEAVARLIADRAARVDHVAAMVVDGNTPSEKLAASLGIKILPALKRANAFSEGVKFLARAGGPASKGRIAARWLGMLGTPAVMDAVSYGRDPEKPYLQQPMTVGRGINSFLNAAIGRWAAGSKSGLPAFEKLLGAPGKDLVFQAIPATEAFKHMSENVSKWPAPTQATAPAGSGGATSPSGSDGGAPWWSILGGAGLLAGGLGAGAYAIQKAMRDKAEAPVNIQTSQGGRLRVTLPTKFPGDNETVVDLPFDEQNALSRSLRDRLKLDTRRRLYAETKSRVQHRGTPVNTLEAVAS